MMANWSIYKAKGGADPEYQRNMALMWYSLTAAAVLLQGVVEKHINFILHLGKKIANREIQLTIQGQTVSSNFGTIDAAQFNIEQLIHAGISNDLFVG